MQGAPLCRRAAKCAGAYNTPQLHAAAARGAELGGAARRSNTRFDQAPAPCWRPPSAMQRAACSRGATLRAGGALHAVVTAARRRGGGGAGGRGSAQARPSRVTAAGHRWLRPPPAPPWPLHHASATLCAAAGAGGAGRMHDVWRVGRRAALTPGACCATLGPAAARLGPAGPSTPLQPLVKASTSACQRLWAGAGPLWGRQLARRRRPRAGSPLPPQFRRRPRAAPHCWEVSLRGTCGDVVALAASKAWRNKARRFHPAASPPLAARPGAALIGPSQVPAPQGR